MAAFHMHRQHTNKKSKIWVFLLSPFVLIVFGLVLAFYWYQSSLKPLSDSTEQLVVTVPVGASASEIGDLLQEKYIIKSSLSFDVYTRVNDYRGKLLAGGYKFMPSQSVQEIVQHLVDGDVATDLITILPAQRLDQIEASFIAAGYTPKEVKEALDPEIYSGHPALEGKPADASLEGYLYPDSYQRNAQTKLETIINFALDEMDAALTPELQKKYSEAGLTNYQAITLASIVEKEVSNSEDRPKVAQVFLKRYNEGIMLGSDVTAFYGSVLIGEEPSVFSDSPYNTRLYEGLPPGPISNVSKESLEAVANPADTEYLFFVSGDDGNTYFSYTVEEHESLTAKYCIELCR